MKRAHFRLLGGRSLQQKMAVMLVVITMISVLFTGVIVYIGSLYLQNYNTVMNDVYAINQLLGAHVQEVEAFEAYVLYGGEALYAAYLTERGRTTRLLEQIDILYEESVDQFLLLEAVRNTCPAFRAACDETAVKRVAGAAFAEPYESALRIGTYVEGYIRNLQELAIGEGQVLYQRHLVRFRVLPLLFLLSVALSFLSILLWTRWTVKHVVSPIHDLIRVAGDMSENQYDTPDVIVYQEDEIARLSQVVNEMKHSTARLVDSLKAQHAMEALLYDEEMRRVRAETAMDTLRLSLLQSQINPHFLFNTLNIISRMAQIEEAPKTEELIVRLANLFRYNLQSLDALVPLENELKIAQDYIAIQQIRFGERIAFSLECTVDPAAYTVPVFLMQPLIENAVIHGISPMEEGGSVTVRVEAVEGALQIAVRDTGVGMSPERVEAALQSDAASRAHISGLGIGSVRNRVEGRYTGGRFIIESRLGEGTNILIIIPLDGEVLHV